MSKLSHDVTVTQRIMVITSFYTIHYYIHPGKGIQWMGVPEPYLSFIWAWHTWVLVSLYKSTALTIVCKQTYAGLHFVCVFVVDESEWFLFSLLFSEFLTCFTISILHVNFTLRNYIFIFNYQDMPVSIL